MLQWRKYPFQIKKNIQNPKKMQTAKNQIIANVDMQESHLSNTQSESIDFGYVIRFSDDSRLYFSKQIVIENLEFIADLEGLTIKVVNLKNQDKIMKHLEKSRDMNLEMEKYKEHVFSLWLERIWKKIIKFLLSIIILLSLLYLGAK